MQSIRYDRGFSLIELMIVVAIIGIIAAIAYPSYTQYVEKARRTDAKGALMGLAAAMERHRVVNGTYLGAGSPNTGAPSIYPDEAPVDGTPKYYDLSIAAVTATRFTLRATPKNAQAGTGLLELDHTGARRWDKNADGDTDDPDEDNWEE